jgi:hypothetical protein
MTWSDPTDSDKHYWHRYSHFYQRHFETLGRVSRILEYGVFKGASIRWLREMYPDAEIFGVDIVPPRPEWPVGRASPISPPIRATGPGSPGC